jgi:hypothetical protein
MACSSVGVDCTDVQFRHTHNCSDWSDPHSDLHMRTAAVLTTDLPGVVMVVLFSQHTLTDVTRTDFVIVLRSFYLYYLFRN